MNFKNDISFDAGGKLIVFGEHQSTINENMPLRNLLYVGRAYEQLVPVEDRYKKKQVKLPKPEFYTFYNGEEAWAKEEVLKLSDAYLEQGGEKTLDLKVKMININPDQHHEILEKCPVLGEYSQFVEAVRAHQRTGEENALQNAVDECIRRGILSEYLRKKGSEAVNMLIAEYDYDMDIKVQREEAKEEGIEQGIARGKELGKVEGIRLGTVNNIMEFLEDLGEIPETLKSKIMQEEKPDVLRRWLKLAAKAETIEQFEKSVEK